jgi:hypothetical protein
MVLGILGLIFTMQGFHVLGLLALPGPARLVAPLPGRCHPWILASASRTRWLHEPTPYAPQTSHFVRVLLTCHPNFATVRKHDQLPDWQAAMATSRPCLPILCAFRRPFLAVEPRALF